MKSYSGPKSRRRNACTALFVVAVALSMGAFTFMLIGPLSGSQYPAGEGRSLAALLRKLDMSSRDVHFVQDNNYTSLDHKFDGLWHDDMLPPNGGYFPMDKETNNTDKLGISMFHQLHCLGMIREEMQHLHEIIDNLNAGGTGEVKSHHNSRRHNDGFDFDAGRPAHHDQGHTLHCFDYLRQVSKHSLLREITKVADFSDNTVPSRLDH